MALTTQSFRPGETKAKKNAAKSDQQQLSKLPPKHIFFLNPCIVACEAHGHPEVIGKDYLVVGIVEHSYFRVASAGQIPADTLFDNLHGFKQHVTFEPVRWKWLPSLVYAK